MSLYRNAVWFYKGFREYTRSGYQAASQNFSPTDLDVDCTGKVYMITGANSGIGKCIATEVAKRGGTVHMVCRNPTAAQQAHLEIMEATKNSNIYVHLLDVSKPRDVCKFASDFADSQEQLDVLVNNAGCMVPKAVDSDGFEINFCTNTLAPYILTRVLLSLLEKSKGRVVNVSSGGMLVQKLNKTDPQCLDLNPFDPTMAYAQHKRQQVVMTEVFAEKYRNVWFSAMHPGWADTPAVRSAMPDFYAKMKDRLRTAGEGADTAVWLAISPASLQHASGLFYQDRVPVSTHLPLAWTKSTPLEHNEFFDYLDKAMQSFLPEKHEK